MPVTRDQVQKNRQEIIEQSPPKKGEKSRPFRQQPVLPQLPLFYILCYPIIKMDFYLFILRKPLAHL